MKSLCFSLLLVSLVACSKNNEINFVNSGGAAGSSGSAGGAAGDTGAGGAVAGSGPTVPDCSTAAKPAFKEGSGDMVAFGLVGGGCFFIDKTEVTQGAYEKFVNDTSKVDSPENRCGWNKGKLALDAACIEQAKADGITLVENSEHPVTCVDACDAEAFCAWAGKRLCNNDKDAWKDGNKPGKDAWYAACSGGDAHSYPYDKIFAKGVCNDPSRNDAECPSGKPCKTTAVGALQGCSDAEGRGLSDMSGNVAEWTGACDGGTGAKDLCRTAGGSFLSNDPLCSFNEELSRETARPTIGFRCCADPAK